MRKHFSKFLIIVTVLLSIILVVSSNLLNRNLTPYEFEKAIVEDIIEEKLEEDSIIEGLYLGYQQIKIKVTSGKYEGETFNIRNPMSRLYNVHTKIGDKVVVSIHEENNNMQSISLYQLSKRKGCLCTYNFILCFIDSIIRMEGLVCSNILNIYRNNDNFLYDALCYLKDMNLSL